MSNFDSDSDSEFNVEVAVSRGQHPPHTDDNSDPDFSDGFERDVPASPHPSSDLLPPWRPPAPAPTPPWTVHGVRALRTLPPLASFAAPLSSKEQPLFLRPGTAGCAGGGEDEEALLLVRTPEALTARALVRRHPSRPSEAVHLRWVVDNVYFASAAHGALCEAAIEAPLCPPEGPSDDGGAAAVGLRHVDLSLGGFAPGPAEYRTLQKKGGGEGGFLLAPDVSFVRDGQGVVWVVPCRGCLVHVVRGAAEAVGLAALKKGGGGSSDSSSSSDCRVTLYGGLRRKLEDVTHFSPAQLEELRATFDRHAVAGGEVPEAQFAAFFADVLPADGFLFEQPADEEYAAAVRAFLASDAVRAACWRLVSGGRAAAAFARVVEALHVALFGSAHHIVELLTQLVAGTGAAVTRAGFAAFLGSAFPLEAGGPEAFLELFPDLFAAGAEETTTLQLRYVLSAMDVFQTWNMLILPFLASKGWKRSNPVL